MASAAGSVDKQRLIAFLRDYSTAKEAHERDKTDYPYQIIEQLMANPELLQTWHFMKAKADEADVTVEQAIQQFEQELQGDQTEEAPLVQVKRFRINTEGQARPADAGGAAAAAPLGGVGSQQQNTAKPEGLGGVLTVKELEAMMARLGTHLSAVTEVLSKLDAAASGIAVWKKKDTTMARFYEVLTATLKELMRHDQMGKEVAKIWSSGPIIMVEPRVWWQSKSLLDHIRAKVPSEIAAVSQSGGPLKKLVDAVPQRVFAALIGCGVQKEYIKTYWPFGPNDPDFSIEVSGRIVVSSITTKDEMIQSIAVSSQGTGRVSQEQLQDAIVDKFAGLTTLYDFEIVSGHAVLPAKGKRPRTGPAR